MQFPNENYKACKNSTYGKPQADVGVRERFYFILSWCFMTYAQVFIIGNSLHILKLNLFKKLNFILNTINIFHF